MEISTFIISIHTSIVVLCIFSIIYLGSISWKKNKWLLLSFSGWCWTLIQLLIGPDWYGLTPDSSLLQNPAFLILYFPGLYLYTFDLIGLKRTSLWKILPHFLPFLTFFGLLSVTGSSNWEKISENEFDGAIVFYIVGFLLNGLVYCYLILKLVKINHQKYKSQYADVNLFITLDWLRWLIFITLGFLILGTISLFVLPLFFIKIPAVGLTLLSMLFVCTTLSYFSFRQPILYQEALFLEKISTPSLKTKKDEENSSGLVSKTNINLSIIEKEELITKIEHYMQEYEPFLNSKVRMPELAKTLKIPRYLFSYLINEYYQINFFQFINQYRIEYAKKLLEAKENQRYTLESISQMAGFNSKSTFNTRFKEIVGKSPKKYQQEHI